MTDDATMTDDMVLNFRPSALNSVVKDNTAHQTWFAVSGSLRPNDQRIAAPEALAKASGMSVKRIIKGIKGLKDAGILQDDPRGGLVIPSDIAFMAWKADQ